MTNNANQIPDIELMELVKSGDTTAYTLLVDRYMSPIFKFAYSFVKNIEKAEDITQDTFIVLWSKADNWEAKGQLKSWLFRIARNKCIDHIRSTKQHLDVDDLEISSKIASQEQQLYNEQMANVIDAHMQALAPRQREAITLVHFVECTNIEAAEIMDISVDALESLLARGRKKLRESLKGLQEEYFYKVRKQ